ncbi:MAG: Gfo/Idh/MocA family oxidoreductase [Caldilineaceae bacterium]
MSSFQIGFMRRFDRGYVAAKQQIEAGVIGTPLVAHAVSRDPDCPDPAWAALERSGGLIVDMGIHDLDILRWLMDDEVTRIRAVGSVQSCPRTGRGGRHRHRAHAVGVCARRVGQCGSGAQRPLRLRNLRRNCGSEGTLRTGYLRDTPVLLLNHEGVHHDVVACSRSALRRRTTQLTTLPPASATALRRAGGADARIALQMALAARQSLTTGAAVAVDGVEAQEDIERGQRAAEPAVAPVEERSRKLLSYALVDSVTIYGQALTLPVTLDDIRQTSQTVL